MSQINYKIVKSEYFVWRPCQELWFFFRIHPIGQLQHIQAGYDPDVGMNMRMIDIMFDMSTRTRKCWFWQFCGAFQLGFNYDKSRFTSFMSDYQEASDKTSYGLVSDDNDWTNDNIQWMLIDGYPSIGKMMKYNA